MIYIVSYPVRRSGNFSSNVLVHPATRTILLILIELHYSVVVLIVLPITVLLVVIASEVFYCKCSYGR